MCAATWAAMTTPPASMWRLFSVPAAVVCADFDQLEAQCLHGLVCSPCVCVLMLHSHYAPTVGAVEGAPFAQMDTAPLLQVTSVWYVTAPGPLFSPLWQCRTVGCDRWCTTYSTVQTGTALLHQPASAVGASCLSIRA